MAIKFGLLERDVEYILSAIKLFPEIEKAVIFGSRAMGNFKSGSDIDIACYGKEVNIQITEKLRSKLNEDVPIPYFVDVLHADSLKNADLIAHIESVGITLYSKSDDPYN